MLELTYDPDARSLYCYFTEIAEGDDADELEGPATALLDADGQLVALEVQLSKPAPESALRFATDHPGVTYAEDTGLITLRFSENETASSEELAYDAIIDTDRRGRVLGLEVVTDPEFGLAERLEHLQGMLVELESEDDEGDEEQEGEQDAAPAPAASQPSAPAEGEEVVRAGFVALVGKPNVGKSTLLNAYLGQKISIVSPKPQTTRVPVRGILDTHDAQVIFIDTPGIHEPRHKLGNFMVEVARRAIPNADVICYVADVSESPSRLDRQIAELVKKARQPHILVLNKVDATHEADKHLQQFRDLGPWQEEIIVSAARNEGLDALLNLITARLPLGPRLYPQGQLSDQNERELVSELIREKVLLNTQEEIPHGVAVEIEEWNEEERVLRIRATITVEKRSHKPIIIGSGGTMLKKIGAAARFEIERSLGQQVFLELWVKVREGWRQNPNDLRWMGYDLKRFKD